jgi:purine-binding chemotaxis protein CheW
MIENITYVPNAPGFIDGVVHSRGQVIPVINLRSRFGMERIPYSISSRLIVIQVEQHIIGIAVDSAYEFKHLTREDILPPPDTLSGPGTEYIEGVNVLDDRVILTLKLQALINPAERETLAIKFSKQL